MDRTVSYILLLISILKNWFNWIPQMIIKRLLNLLQYGIGDVYYAGGLYYGIKPYANRKVYSSKATADARIVNTDGRNGGFVGATVVAE